MKRVELKPLADSPASVDPSLLDGISAEMTKETRPFLQFIIDNARWLVGLVVVLLVAVAGTAGWRMYAAGQEADVHEALAKIRQMPPDAGQIQKLEALASSCPGRLRVCVYTDLAVSALAQGNHAKAGEAYGIVAREAADTAVGQAAALNEAGMLLAQKKYAEGVSMLQKLIPVLPEGTRMPARQMLADAAALAGQNDLAARTYEELASLNQDADRGYYLSRAAGLRAEKTEKTAKGAAE